MARRSEKAALTNCARDTDEATHGEGSTRADGGTVLGEGGGQGLVGTVLVLNLESVLEELRDGVSDFQSRID